MLIKRFHLFKGNLVWLSENTSLLESLTMSVITDII